MNRLRELREQKGLSQRALCKVIGVSQGTLSNWERGEHDIDNSSLIKLSSYFSVTIDYLLGNDQPDPHSQSPPQQKSPQDEGENPVMQEIKELLPKLSKDEMEKALSYLKFLEESE